MVRTYPLIRGIASYILPKKIFVRPGSGGSFSSAYCYSVWLRHLVQLKNAGLINDIESIKNIAEIGPGDSLGMGLAAMYTGADNYFAFDVIRHTNMANNKKINNELLKLFEERIEIPHGTKEFLNTKPVLSNYEFPADILNKDRSYYQERHKTIECNLDNMEKQGAQIRYVVPWMGQIQKDVKDIDLIISQAVMEHVDDVTFAYAEMYRWLKPGGIISHQIDFRTHEMTDQWDGHFYIGQHLWKILAHGRKYPMNRLPLSAHIKAIEKTGFKIKNIVPFRSQCNFSKQAPRVPEIAFQEEDLITSSALIQAIK